MTHGRAESNSRFRFFVGKGGVGKTTTACAIAVELADRGLRVLLVSTDPASNLDEVLQTSIGGKPTAVTGVSGLFALNIDPEASARAYRERAIAPYRGILPAAAVQSMEEQLSGACTTEIAAFDEFTALLSAPKLGDAFDHVIFDTAPTGHTLRLLQLPSAWTGYLDSNRSGQTCLGPLSALKHKALRYRQAFEILQSPEETTIVLVARPDIPSLREAERTRHELEEMGVNNMFLVLNGLFEAPSEFDAPAIALAMRGQEAIAAMPAALAALPRTEVALQSYPLLGVEALRRVRGAASNSTGSIFIDSAECALPGTTLAEFVNRIEIEGHGVVMTMGKGGVGKTTVAAAIACELAARGHRTTLTTTDPAAHLESTLQKRPHLLEVARIDPAVEVQRYSQGILADARDVSDEDGLKLLAEELRSPCTEEVAVFRAFADVVAMGEDRFVVIDTAPTGHTVLLLDAAEAYHREVLRSTSDTPEAVLRLLPRLRDPILTKVILVAVPEPTPVHEAAALQADLARAAIPVFGWILNQSMAASGTIDPRLRARAAAERSVIAEANQLAARLAILPWSASPLTSILDLCHVPTA